MSKKIKQKIGTSNSYLFYAGVKKKMKKDNDHGQWIWVPKDQEIDARLIDNDGNEIVVTKIDPSKDFELDIKIEKKKTN